MFTTIINDSEIGRNLRYGRLGDGKIISSLVIGGTAFPLVVGSVLESVFGLITADIGTGGCRDLSDAGVR